MSLSVRVELMKQNFVWIFVRDKDQRGMVHYADKHESHNRVSDYGGSIHIRLCLLHPDKLDQHAEREVHSSQ